MVMIMSAAAFMVVIVVMMLMFMLMLMMMLMLMVVMMLVLMLMMMFVVMMMLMLVVVVMVMVVAAAATLIVVMMMVLVLLLLGQLLQSSRQGIPAFHGRQQLLAVQFVPRGRHNGGGGVLLPQQGHTGIQLFLAHTGSPAQNNGAGVLHLIIEKLAKVSHIHLAFLCIHYCGVAVQLDVYIFLNTLYSLDHVGKLTYA